MSNCCTECFLDEYIKDFIKEHGILGRCDYCKSKNVHIINPDDLQGLFTPLVSLYTAQIECMPMEILKECDEGRFIWEILSEDWEVFDDSSIGKEIIEEMFMPCDPSDPRPLFLDNYVEREDELWGHDQDYSDKLKHDWENFCNEIAHKNRFFPNKNRVLGLLDDILVFSEYIIGKDEYLFRARISSGKKYKPNEMGRPPANKAIEGRANPAGIAYLYLASDCNTAISEIRPQLGDRVSVAKFKINKKLQVIDLRQTAIGSPFRWGDNLEFVLKVQGFLKMLGFILSKPVDKNKSLFDYLPTQYLCEFIKKQGYEGVVYMSKLGKGHNIVLFNDNKTTCSSVELHKVTSIEIKNEKVLEKKRRRI